ncbi:MAG: hypothetical protein LBQ59_05390 [Candidatus Peribacteria bacterium]|nr:hypothetical protein [Candidatus Peribacteria bacterium]MDR1944846.1 hypothetical protein [Candidatus Peribacteria bacterium]MDR1945456.1 hypothetical protein [Candidatus Peribacteria bacterium]
MVELIVVITILAIL